MMTFLPVADQEAEGVEGHADGDGPVRRRHGQKAGHGVPPGGV